MSETLCLWQDLNDKEQMSPDWLMFITRVLTCVRINILFLVYSSVGDDLATEMVPLIQFLQHSNKSQSN